METIRKNTESRYVEGFFFFFFGGGGGGAPPPPPPARSYLTGLRYIPRWGFKKILKPSRAMNGIPRSVSTVYFIDKPRNVM